MINGAGILVIDEKGNLLVLHRKDFVPEGNHWGLPGGKVDEKNTPVETAILKTFQEVKLKYKKKDLRFLGEFKFKSEGNDVIYSAWVVDYNGEEIKLNLEGHDTYKWASPKDLLQDEDLMEGMYPILTKYLQGVK